MNLTDDDLAIREFRVAVAAGRPETIASVATAHIWPLYRSHFDELLPVVEALPGPLLDRNPCLRVLHRMTPLLARSVRPFKPLVHPDDARTMTPDELDMVTLVQTVGFRFSGDVAAAVIYARRLEERIGEARSGSDDRAAGPLWFFHQQIGSTFLAAGDTSLALRQFSLARQLGSVTRQPDAERMALGRTALAHAVRGSLDQAETALAEAEHYPEPRRPHVTSTHLTEKTTRALIEVERMTDGAEPLLDELEPYDSIQLTWPFALLARTRFLFAHHRPDEALETVRLASDAHPSQHGSFANDVITAASIEALWTVGALREATRLAGSTARVGQLTRFAIIRHALLEGRFDLAERGVTNMSTEKVGPGHRAELTLLSAWLEMASGDSLDPHTAKNVARLAQTANVRRIVAMLPLLLVDRVRSHLSLVDANDFENATVGLAHADHPRSPKLTPSELRVLNVLPTVGTTAEIASVLHVSPNTIKSQLRSLYRKLGCSTRHDAVVIASRLRLLSARIELS